MTVATMFVTTRKQRTVHVGTMHSRPTRSFGIWQVTCSPHLFTGRNTLPYGDVIDVFSTHGVETSEIGF